MSSKAKSRISLTKHVQERRAKGHIPPNVLREVGEYLVKLLPENAEDGTYKFYNNTTVAIIKKTHGGLGRYRFITFYGKTGYTISVKDGNFGEFKVCKSREKTKGLRVVKPDEYIKLIIPKNIQDKITKGTYYIKEIHEVSLPRVRFLVISKFNDNLVTLLGRDGSLVGTLHKNKLDFIDLKEEEWKTQQA